MKTRIVTGIIGLAVLVGALWWGEVPWTLFVTLLAFMAIGEWNKMGNIENNTPIGWIGYLLVFGLFVIKLPMAFILAFGVLTIITLSLRDHANLHIEKISYHFFGFYYIMFGFFFSLELYGMMGKEFVLFIFILIWLSDSLAYFTGYFFGKHKMAPIISPKKTYEGLLGGIIFTLLLAHFANNGLGVGLSVWQSIGFGLFVACAAPIGDLFESSVKRHFGVKDSGKLLPGHGGVLDRFDSFLFVMIGLYAILFIS